MRSSRCNLLQSMGLLLGLFAASWASANDPQPNILFVLMDDLGYADVGFTGAQDVRTPNLDALAREGTVLTRHYAMHICSPTRAALMTARHPMRYGLQQSVYHPSTKAGLPLDEVLLPGMLKKAGYQTYAFGKWHLGLEEGYKPHQRGFDHFYGSLGGQADYYTHIYRDKIDWWRNDERVDEVGYTTTLLGDEAARVIDNHTGDAPLFLYLAFKVPHSPYEAPPAAVEKAKAEGRKMTRRETYASMVEEGDRSVGKVIDALRETNQLDNTIIIFSSDNGGAFPEKYSSNGTLRDGKWWLYEGGVRVPAFIRWPGHVPAGETTDDILSIMDWYPSLAKLLGQPMRDDAPIDGRDIFETLATGSPSPHRDDLLIGVSRVQNSVVSRNWKLVLNGKHEDLLANKKLAPNRSYRDTMIEAVELYDLGTDIGETRNVAAEHPEIVERLTERIRRSQAEAAVPFREAMRNQNAKTKRAKTKNAKAN